MPRVRPHFKNAFFSLGRKILNEPADSNEKALMRVQFNCRGCRPGHDHRYVMVRASLEPS